MAGLFSRHRRLSDETRHFFDNFGDPGVAAPGQFPTAAFPKNQDIQPARDIRLVEILPGAFEDDIKCRLSVHSLVNTALGKQFTALSYTCGGFINHATVHLNEVPDFPILRNLIKLGLWQNNEILSKIPTNPRTRTQSLNTTNDTRYDHAEKTLTIKALFFDTIALQTPPGSRRSHQTLTHKTHPVLLFTIPQISIYAGRAKTLPGFIGTG